MNERKWKIAGIVVIVVALLVLVYMTCFSYPSNKNSVVYLTTGEVYVGKFSPASSRLTDAYIFQITKDASDPTKNNFQLNPVNEALWAPKYVNVNKDNIIFFGPLDESSKIAETLSENSDKK